MVDSDKMKWVRIWLITGLFMIAIQIFLGGITRLTGSGLSITRWDIVTGTLYPFSEEAWESHFELYKSTPQYQKINQGMSLEEFKFIFFWEYFHRLWARIMGLVFFIPFVFFLLRGYLTKRLIFDLIVVVLLAALVASLGWIMVASGLTSRPWVNAYKLSFHLMAAVGLLSWLLWVIWKTGSLELRHYARPGPFLRSTFYMLTLLLLLQLFLGGVVAGMKAALVAPTWPDINGQYIPDELFKLDALTPYVFGEYEVNAGPGIIMQFFHRTLAYVIFVLALVALLGSFRLGHLQIFRNTFVIFILVVMQIMLGVITLLGSYGGIPIWSGVAHQFCGVLLFCVCLYNLFGIRKSI